MRPHLLAPLIGTLMLAASASALSADAEPWDAVSYKEKPEAGPLKGNRPISTSGGRNRYGIDINSNVEIQIDASRLRDAMIQRAEGRAAASQALQLRTRLRSLELAADSLQQEAQNVKDLFDLWSSGRAKEFATKLRESARARHAIFDSLYQARRQRLQQTGLEPEAADRAAKEAFVAVLSGPGMDYGYNWELLGRLFKEEITHAQARLAALGAELGLRLGIVAHVISSGTGIPVRMPPYNQVAQVAETQYQKLRFAATPEERELYKQNETTAKAIGDAKDAGEAVAKLLEAQYLALRTELTALMSAAAAARDELRAKAKNLEQWRSVDRRREWLQSVDPLPDTTDGKKVRQLWGELETMWQTTLDDLDALRAFADIQSALTGKTAPDAIETILKRLELFRDPSATTLRILDPATWDARLTKITEFARAVDALAPAVKVKLLAAPSPYADLLAIKESLTHFVEAAKQSGKDIAQWVSETIVKYRPTRMAAELPVPEGNQAIPVASDSGLNTQMYLREVAARKHGDEVMVQYGLYQGDRLVKGGWTDNLSLQTYGWSSDVLASLAFAKQSGSGTWRPTAAMNWMLSYRSWPEAKEDGLPASGPRWLSGAGISVMPLNPPEDNGGVQLGLAATLGLIDNRVLLGVGGNLQATENRGFVFLSIRLVEFPGLSGPLTGTR